MDAPKRPLLLAWSATAESMHRVRHLQIQTGTRPQVPGGVDSQSINSICMLPLKKLTGDREAVYVWLERAAQEWSNITLWIEAHPYFDPLRGEPRFEKLLRRMNFPEMSEIASQ